MLLELQLGQRTIKSLETVKFFKNTIMFMSWYLFNNHVSVNIDVNIEVGDNHETKMSSKGRVHKKVGNSIGWEIFQIVFNEPFPKYKNWRCKQYFPVYFGETVFMEHFCTEEFWWHLQNISVNYTLYSILSLCLHTGGGPKPTTTPPVTPRTTSPVTTDCGNLRNEWLLPIEIFRT